MRIILYPQPRWTRYSTAAVSRFILKVESSREPLQRGSCHPATIQNPLLSPSLHSKLGGSHLCRWTSSNMLGGEETCQNWAGCGWDNFKFTKIPSSWQNARMQLTNWVGKAVCLYHSNWSTLKTRVDPPANNLGNICHPTPYPLNW